MNTFVISDAWKGHAFLSRCNMDIRHILIISVAVFSALIVSGCTSPLGGGCVAQGNVVKSLSERCCEGLEKVPNCFVGAGGECDCDANTEKGEMLCLQCGDGVCQPDENKCSCPVDCTGNENQHICDEGERQNYTCPNNRTTVEWCVCKDNDWFCPVNPAVACIGHGSCRNDSDCLAGKEICVDSVCELICKQNYSYDCVDKNVFWFDSCGKIGEMKEKCGAGCINGVCIGCKAEDHIECYEHDLWWFDSCGVKERVYEDCLGTCNLEECCNPNVTFRCYQGDIHWVDACNYTQDDLKENCTAGHGCYVENDTCVTCDSHVSFTCVNGDTGDLYWFNSCGDREDMHTECEQGCFGVACLPSCVDPDINETDPYLVSTTVVDRHGLNRQDACEDSRYLKEYFCSATHDADYEIVDCGLPSLANCTAGACVPVT